MVIEGLTLVYLSAERLPGPTAGSPKPVNINSALIFASKLSQHEPTKGLPAG